MTRLCLLGALVAAASCERNPLVRMEALVGLSPAPLERFTGIRTVFSGMTAAAYDMTRLDFLAAVRSNVLSPVIAVICVVCIVSWKFPKATPEREPLFLGAAVVGSILVHAAWEVLN